MTGPGPFPVEHLRLRLVTKTSLDPWQDRALRRWTATLSIAKRFPADEDFAPPAAVRAAAGTKVAVAQLWDLDPYVQDALDVLDELGGDEYHGFAPLFTRGPHEAMDDVGLEVGFPDATVVLDRVRVAPAWRGRGLGVLVAAHAIRELRGLAECIACYPAPFELERGTPAWAAELARLEALWARLGFVAWDHGIWLLAPDAPGPDDAIVALSAS